VRGEVAALWRRTVLRCRALFRTGAVDRDLDEEMRQHLDLEAEDLIRTEGLSPDEARRRARIAFGGVDRYAEAHRDVRGWRWLEELWQDIRYSVRGLRRTPAFTVSAVAVLALGIGSSTAMFSAIDAVLLTRLPYPHDDQLVGIYEQNSPTNRFAISTVDYQAVVDQQRSFSAVGAFTARSAAVSAGGAPVQMTTGRATAGFLRVLGVRVAVGREVQVDDERPGAPPVVVVGDRFAVSELGGPAAAIGRSVVVEGTPYTVIGVLPPGVTELAGLKTEIWTALRIAAPDRRGPFWLRLIARRRPGVTLAASGRDLAEVSERLYPLWASTFPDKVARLTPVSLRTTILGSAGQQLGIFSAAVALVLLIAVANVASLMLVRVTGRWREVVLRATLGARRGRLIRMLVTESVVLAVAGALLGVVLGVGGLRLLAVIAPDLHGIDQARVGWSGASFAGVVTLAAGIVIAGYPIVLLPGQDSVALREGDRAVGAGRRLQGLRAAFVIAEFALALPLLAGAGLLLNSFLRLERVDPGVDPRGIVTVGVQLPNVPYDGDSAISAYWTRALARVREIPSVTSAGIATAVPPNDGNVCCNNFDLVDHPVMPGGAQPVSPWIDASADYFATLGIPLLAGRLFTPGDTAGAPSVVVVSRTWAAHYFPEGSAVGRRLHGGGCTGCPATTIVGVVADVKYQGLGESADAVYDPVTQGWPLSSYLFVRTRGDPAGAIAAVRAAMRSADPGVPLDDIAPMEDRFRAATADPRRVMALVGGVASIAVVLAGIGIFGMLSYAVSARRREIGIRMALGAGKRSVVALVVGQGMRYAAVGALLGLGIAAIGTRVLAATLFGVSPTDPATLFLVTAVLIVIASLASWLAARRAAMVDPVEAMRAE
jgi:predicted permease